MLRQRNRVFTESVGCGEVFSQKPGFWALFVSHNTQLRLILKVRGQFIRIYSVYLRLLKSAIALKI
ncbi:hypothetical protein [Tychonema sp. BBK16]|uniref:hypothetical protein n=1 Tax=Tychonema sp. BBK16 TaxID=2699888 RepID=UPI001F366991|nr:hypothetical protein [Tychonema sp. BBK16]MCF6373554.1 hypothetical protein [Tychonema sp. BBK16]